MISLAQGQIQLAQSNFCSPGVTGRPLVWWHGIGCVGQTPCIVVSELNSSTWVKPNVTIFLQSLKQFNMLRVKYFAPVFHNTHPKVCMQWPYCVFQVFNCRIWWSMLLYHSLVKIYVIPQHAKSMWSLTLNVLIFFWGNMNIYLHFTAFLHIDLTQVLKTLPQVREGPTYSI